MLLVMQCCWVNVTLKCCLDLTGLKCSSNETISCIFALHCRQGFTYHPNTDTYSLAGTWYPDKVSSATLSNCWTENCGVWCFHCEHLRCSTRSEHCMWSPATETLWADAEQVWELGQRSCLINFHFAWCVYTSIVHTFQGESLVYCYGSQVVWQSWWLAVGGSNGSTLTCCRKVLGTTGAAWMVNVAEHYSGTVPMLPRWHLLLSITMPPMLPRWHLLLSITVALQWHLCCLDDTCCCTMWVYNGTRQPVWGNTVHHYLCHH